MVCSTFIARLLARLRRMTEFPASCGIVVAGMSWPELADARQRPGHKTWLVARAVSLRAF